MHIFLFLLNRNDSFIFMQTPVSLILHGLWLWRKSFFIPRELMYWFSDGNDRLKQKPNLMFYKALQYWEWSQIRFMLIDSFLWL